MTEIFKVRNIYYAKIIGSVKIIDDQVFRGIRYGKITVRSEAINNNRHLNNFFEFGGLWDYLNNLTEYQIVYNSNSYSSFLKWFPLMNLVEMAVVNLK